MLNLGQLTKYLTLVPHEIGEKIKEAMTTYVNDNEAKAREQLQAIIPELEELGGYEQIVNYLRMNTTTLDES